MTKVIGSLPLCFFCLFLCAGKVAGAQTSAVQSVSVTASDYSFQPLPEIQHGTTVFSFSNQGKVRHEMFIVRLKADATPEQYLKAAATPGGQRGLVEEPIGILIAGPGKSPGGKLLVDLIKGATYVVGCNLRDTPDSPAHLTFGMLTSFTVK